jgi:hypothetical protein
VELGFSIDKSFDDLTLCEWNAIKKAWLQKVERQDRFFCKVAAAVVNAAPFVTDNKKVFQPKDFMDEYSFSGTVEDETNILLQKVRQINKALGGKEVHNG